MPIYEYKCSACGKEFEIMQRITDSPLVTCESCGGELRKLVTHTSFVLKGSGWYVTDYPSADRKKAMENSGRAKKDSSSSGTKKDGTNKKAVNE